MASAGIAAGISVLVGWGCGLIPAGLAKLTVALAVGLQPWVAILIGGSPILAVALDSALRSSALWNHR